MKIRVFDAIRRQLQLAETEIQTSDYIIEYYRSENEILRKENDDLRRMVGIK